MNQRNICHMREESTNLTRAAVKGKHDVKISFPALWLEPGMYTVYFKLLLWGDTSSPRHVSDVLHLDVGGRTSGWNSVLSPRIDWEFSRARMEQAVGVAG